MRSKRYYSIDIMKLTAACLVLGIHAQLFSDVSRLLSEAVTGAVGRMGVPFFACVSGFFLFKAEMEGKSPLRRQILSLIRYYLVFSIIYITWDYVNGNFSGMELVTVVTTILKRFLLYGTYYHLWFFPYMILSLIVIYLGFRMHVLPFLGGFAFTAYIFDVFTYGWNGIGQMFIPGLDRLMEWFDFEYIRRFAGLTLPAAFLGILIYYTCAYWENKLHDRILWFAWIISMLVNIAETVFVMETGIAAGTTVTLTLLPTIYFTFMLGLRYPLESQKQAGKFCRSTSVVMYGLHPLFLEVLENIFHGKITATVLWGITLVLCILISCVDEIFLKEAIKKYDIKKE